MDKEKQPMNPFDPAQSRDWSTARAGASHWRRQLAELALACAGSCQAEEMQRVGDLWRLMVRAPDRAAIRGLQLPDAARLKLLMETGAGETAALALIGADCGYLLSRGGTGQFLASIALPGAADETSASGDSLALAVVGAVALALVEADEPARPARAVDTLLN